MKCCPSLKPISRRPTTTPRFFKVEFPIYDGEVDPLVWLNRADTQRTDSTDNVGIASFHLTGDKHLWYHQYKGAHGFQPGIALLN